MVDPQIFRIEDVTVIVQDNGPKVQGESIRREWFYYIWKGEQLLFSSIWHNEHIKTPIDENRAFRVLDSIASFLASANESYEGLGNDYSDKFIETAQQVSDTLTVYVMEEWDIIRNESEME